MTTSLLPKPARLHKASSISFTPSIILPTPQAADTNRTCLSPLEGEQVFVTGHVDGFKFFGDKAFTCIRSVSYTSVADSMNPEEERDYKYLDHSWMDTSDFPKLPVTFTKVHIICTVIQYQRSDGSVAYGLKPVLTTGATIIVATAVSNVLTSIKEAQRNYSASSAIQKEFAGVYKDLTAGTYSLLSTPITFANLGRKTFISIIKKHERKIIKWARRGDKVRVLNYLKALQQACVPGDEESFDNRLVA